jgi:phage host-nuclease inhibitor protein Gam
MSDRDNWLMSEDELDEYLGAEEDGEILPPIAAEEQAQGYVRAYAHHERERLAIEVRAQREIDRIMVWKADEMGKIERRTSWLSGLLQSFLWSSKAKSIKFPHGTLKRTKGREKVIVEDEEAFIERHRGTDLVRVKEEVAKSAIAKHIKTTGEVPEGVEMERAEDTFSITLTEERTDV